MGPGLAENGIQNSVFWNTKDGNSISNCRICFWQDLCSNYLFIYVIYILECYATYYWLWNICNCIVIFYHYYKYLNNEQCQKMMIGHFFQTAAQMLFLKE